MEFKTKDLIVKAIFSNGGNAPEIKEIIGPGARFLDMRYEDVGGPGRGTHKALVIRSATQRWVLDTGETLVVLPDGDLRVMSRVDFNFFFAKVEDD